MFLRQVAARLMHPAAVSQVPVLPTESGRSPTQEIANELVPTLNPFKQFNFSRCLRIVCRKTLFLHWHWFKSLLFCWRRPKITFLDIVEVEAESSPSVFSPRPLGAASDPNGLKHQIPRKTYQSWIFSLYGTIWKRSSGGAWRNEGNVWHVTMACANLWPAQTYDWCVARSLQTQSIICRQVTQNNYMCSKWLFVHSQAGGVLIFFTLADVV